MSPYYTNILYALALAFVGLNVVAALYDVAKYVIPNTIVLAIAGLFPIAALALPFDVDWLSHLGAAASVLAVGLVLYHFRVLGAGDVKLLTATALWAGFDLAPTLLIYVALTGGALALALLALRKLALGVAFYLPSLGGISNIRVLTIGYGLPYGVAIAAGSIATAMSIPWLGLFLSPSW